MYPLALSTNWNSRRHEDGEGMLQEIRDMGIEWVELGHAVSFGLWPGILRSVDKKIVKICSLHNFCPLPLSEFPVNCNSYEFTDSKKKMRDYAVALTCKTIDHAAEVGAGLVVLHLGNLGPRGVTRKMLTGFHSGKLFSKEYGKVKVEAIAERRKRFSKVYPYVHECLEKIVEKALECKVKLAVEVRSGFEEFPLEEEMENIFNDFPSKAIGYWHDFGHAATKENLGWHDSIETLKKYQSRILGGHLQDCRPPNYDHLGMGEGCLDFKKILAFFPKNSVYVLELTSRSQKEQIKRSLNLWNGLKNTLP